MNEITKKLQSETALINLDGFSDDGFSGFTDEYEGEDQDVRIIQGEPIKYTNESVWVDRAGRPLPPELELIVAKVKRYAVKWGNKEGDPPLVNNLIPDGKKFPDIKALNEACPNEWRERFGQLKGPWEAQHVVYLFDPRTMNKFTWPTSTSGGHVCVTDIVEKTNMMREYTKQPRCYAVVKLRSAPWVKKYNRQRPHLEVQRYVTFGDGGEMLPVADTPKIAGPTSAAEPLPGMKTVTPPTGKQATKDEIPF